MKVGGSVYFGRDNGDSDSPDIPDINFIDFTDSNIAGNARFDKMNIAGRFNGLNLKVVQTLRFLKSKLAYLDLYGGEFGQLEIRSTSFTRDDPNAWTRERKNLDDEEKREQDEVRELGTISLDTDGVSVSRSMFLDRSTIPKFAAMTYMKVPVFLSLLGTHLHQVDLTGSIVSAKLILGTAKNRKKAENTDWEATNRNQSFFIMNDAIIKTIDAPLDKQNIWPETTVINNLHWDEFNDSNGKIKLEDVKSWLSHTVFSASSYDQAREVFMKSGMEKEAKEIGIEKRHQERKDAWNRGDYFNWFLMTLLWVFIDYGYNTWYAGLWIIGFIVFGGIVFNTTKTSRYREIIGDRNSGFKEVTKFQFDRFGVGYSFDMLLPLVKLREKHYQVDIKEPLQRYYFYFHKIMGYVLGSVFVAGISGLTH